MEGKRHDSGMLRESNLLQRLIPNSIGFNNRILCIYRDPAYPLRQRLQAPFLNGILTPQQAVYNKSMSQVRVSVEWLFRDIIDWFKFLDFKKNLKIGLSPI